MPAQTPPRPTVTPWLAVLAAVAVAFILGPGRPATADSNCPTSYFGVDGSVFLQSSAAKDTAGSTYCSCPSPSSFSLGYDLVVGRAGAYAQSGLSSIRAEIGTTDSYTLTSASPGEPFTIRAQLHLSGWVSRACAPPQYSYCTNSRVIATLAAGPDNRQSYEGLSPSGALEVTIQGHAGVPFQISISCSAHMGSVDSQVSDGSIVAQLKFVGLPAGSRVESCQGFVVDGPVAVRGKTWGSLKEQSRGR